MGNGANMKLVVNMMMGTMMTALAEGLNLADKSGLSQGQLLEVLGLGAMACPMFKMKVSSLYDVFRSHLRLKSQLPCSVTTSLDNMWAVKGSCNWVHAKCLFWKDCSKV